MSEIKKCHNCKEEKSVELFGTYNKSKDGYKYSCNPCLAKLEQERIDKLTEEELKTHIENRNNKGKERRNKIKEKNLKNPPNVISKICPQCKVDKKAEEFGSNITKRDGLGHICKSCGKENREKDKENITEEEYKKYREKKNKEARKRAEKNKANNLENPPTITHKICSECDIDKDILNFTNKITNEDGYDTTCKTCAKELRDEIIANRTKEEIEAHKEKDIKDRRARVAWLHSIKSEKPCLDCDRILNPYLMDYDHIPERGEKLYNISFMVIHNISKDKILAEIAKCDLICCYCHGKRTEKRLDEKYGLERGKTRSKKVKIMLKL
jgi:hypothetical protein